MERRMNWILIIFVWGGGQGMAPAITSVTVDTEAACQAAGVKSVQDLRTSSHGVKFSCVKKN